MAGFFNRLKFFGSNIILIVGILFASCFLIYGAAIFFFQLVHWFKYDVWVEIGVIELFRDYIPFAHSPFEDPLCAVPETFKGSWPWIIYPTSWFGLHKLIYSVFQRFPLSWAMVFGFCLIYWVLYKTLSGKDEGGNMGIIISLLFFLFLLVSCVSISDVTPAGKDTWMVAGTGTGLYAGSIRADLYNKAGAFCAKKNKIIAPVRQNYIGPGPGSPSSAELVFRCLLEADPEWQERENTKSDKTQVIPVKIMGYSPKTMNKDIKLDSQRAMLDAKMKAIEKAGIKIESSTMVENFQLLSDFVESKAKGILLPGFEFIEFGYDENGVYKVLLIGEVRSLIK